MSLTEKVYKKAVIHRYDENGYYKYFTYKDYKDILYRPLGFTQKGYKLDGGLYYKENYKKDRLVIFCHGLGGGYSSYFTEVATLVNEGYMVYTFDYIGCDNSEGESIVSLTESLPNLVGAINFLRSLDEFKNIKLTVIGHSWGGYSSLNISNYVDDIDSIVTISGFVSTTLILNDMVSGFKRILYKSALKYEDKQNKEYFHSNAIDALNKTKSRVLVIHDKTDNVVKYNCSAKLLQERVNNPNVRFLITEGKKHQPHYTIEAVTEGERVFGDFFKQVRSKKIKTLEEKKEYFKDTDWDLIVKQDKEVWKEIFKTIEGE